eukprot:scaffold26096_cov62-Cyclotella_meneghiniana.AAC.1
MRFPPSTKAAFFTAITSILHSPSTAFSTTARQSYSSTARRDFQRQVVARRPSSTCASADSLLSVRSAWAANSRRYNHPLSVRGGSTTSLSSTAMTETAAPKEIYRKDYKPLAYKVSNVAMNFDIRDGKTVVERLVALLLYSELTVVLGDTDGDGEADALTLLSIQLNGKDLQEGKDYTINGDELSIPASVLGDGTSKITTKVEIVPETNTQLSGLYKSGSMYCTQCEAIG